MAGATRCKHCQADLKAKSNRKSLLGKYKTFRVGFLAGILFSVLVWLLIWAHFNWN